MEISKLREAHLKVHWAAKHVAKLSELLREKRPFSYVLETNTETSERATFAKKDEAVIDDAKLICGDALHNLRSALDYAYAQVVAPFAASPRELRQIQFPFSETATRLDEAIKNRLANRVSPEFFDFILGLKPHGEAGGNELLYLLHGQEVIDKHSGLIPIADYTRLSIEAIRRQVPDFPTGFNGTVHFGQNRRDIYWPLSADVRASLGLFGIPVSKVLEKELDVPVDIVFRITGASDTRPLVPTLHQLVDLTRVTVERMEPFVSR